MKNQRKKYKYLLTAVLASVVFLSSCKTSSTSMTDKIQQNGAQSSENQREKLSDSQLLDSLGIYDGITVDGLDVSRQAQVTAIDTLTKAKEAQIDQQQLVLQYNDNQYTYSFQELGFQYDYAGAVKKAFEIGRQGDKKTNLETIKNLIKTPIDIPLTGMFNSELVASAIADIANKLDQNPVNGRFRYVDGKVEAVQGINGYVVDVEKLQSLIAAVYKTETVSIPMVEKLATQVDAGKATTVDGVIGSASSNFNDGYWERAENIRVSTNYLNGVVVNPGETFSMNDYLGENTAEKGYQMAVVILNGKEVPGMGGGLCQTATTLYQAVLRADLEIVERSPHTEIMPYAPIGLDATVEYGSADFVFRNSFDFPIVITGYVDGGTVVFEILGDTKTKNYEITIYSEQTDSFGNGGGTSVSYKYNEKTGETVVLNYDYYPGLKK